MLRLLLGLSLFLQAPAFAKAPVADVRACEALMQAIVRNSGSKTDPTATLPSLLRFDLKKEQIAEYYLLNRSTWVAHFDQKLMGTYIQSYLDDVTLTKDQSTDLKLMRALFKQLRFAFALFDEGHKPPKFVDNFVKVMGDLQDASINGQKDLVKAKAREVQTLLNGPRWAEFNRGLDSFVPASGKNFRKYLNDQIDFLKEGVKSRRVEKRAFHDMRKTLGRILCLLNSINVLSPTPSTIQAHLFVNSLYKRIGDINDENVAAHFNHPQTGPEKFDIPDDVRAGLKSLVKLFEASAD